MSPEDEVRQRLSEQSDEDLRNLLRRHDTDEWRPEVFTVAEEILRSRGATLELTPTPEATPTPESEPDLVAIATFTTVVAADACRSALDAAGFDVVALDEFVLRLDQSLGPGLGGLRLAVPAAQAEEAKAFLAAADRGELAGASLECPACGSTAVRSRRRVNRSGTVVNYLMGVPAEDASVSFTCTACGKTWE